MNLKNDFENFKHFKYPTLTILRRTFLPICTAEYVFQTMYMGEPLK